MFCVATILTMVRITSDLYIVVLVVYILYLRRRIFYEAVHKDFLNFSKTYTNNTTINKDRLKFLTENKLQKEFAQRWPKYKNKNINLGCFSTVLCQHHIVIYFAGIRHCYFSSI